MNLTTQINIMIDTHPEISYDKCPGCPRCRKIRELGEKLDKSKSMKDKYQSILDKGQGMTTGELRKLLANGVTHTAIMEALGVSQTKFNELTKPFRPEPKKTGKITPEQFIKERKAGLSNGEIADKYEVNPGTLNHNIKQWRKKGIISKETLDSLPKRKPGRFVPLLTKEQYMRAKEHNWTKKKTAEIYNVSIKSVNNSIAHYEVAE